MSDLEPELSERDLPADVLALREQAVREHEVFDDHLQVRIDAHLNAYDGVIDALITTHKAIADRTDLEIGADTRWSAMWELAGRCLAVSRVVLNDLRGGFASEADGSLRGLHEVTQLLVALSIAGEEEDALRRWLADEYIKPATVRKILDRHQQRARAAAAAAGDEEEVGDVGVLSLDIYQRLSKSAHHRRRGFPESVAPALREFTYGPHPNAPIRADHVVFAGLLLEEVVIVVGGAFSRILGPGQGFLEAIVPPLIAAITLARQLFPLE